MHLILTGATGLVGSAALDALLTTPAVSKISILTRRPVAMLEGNNDPRINVITHQNFAQYDPDVLSKLRGAEGCIWALGISQTQVSSVAEYVEITKTYPLQAAEAFKDLPGTAGEPFRFIYVSGEGATQKPGMLLTPMYGKVKGEAEAALSELRGKFPYLHAQSVRPAFVDPVTHTAIKPFIPQIPPGLLMTPAKMVLPPVMRALYKQGVTPTQPLGKFLVDMAMGKLDGQLEGNGISQLGALSVVQNVGLRRLAGL